MAAVVLKFVILSWGSTSILYKGPDSRYICSCRFQLMLVVWQLKATGQAFTEDVPL